MEGTTGEKEYMIIFDIYFKLKCIFPSLSPLIPDSDATDVSSDPFQSKSGTDIEKSKDDNPKNVKISSKICDLFGPEVKTSLPLPGRSRQKKGPQSIYSPSRSGSEPSQRGKR